MSLLSPAPIPGLKMRPPIGTPQPGQVIIGYERYKQKEFQRPVYGAPGDAPKEGAIAPYTPPTLP